MECRDVAFADRAADRVSMYNCAVLLYSRNHTEETGDDRGGDTDSVTGKPRVRTGVYQVSGISAGVCGAGEVVSGDVLFEDVGDYAWAGYTVSPYPSKRVG